MVTVKTKKESLLRSSRNACCCCCRGRGILFSFLVIVVGLQIFVFRAFYSHANSGTQSENDETAPNMPSTRKASFQKNHTMLQDALTFFGGGTNAQQQQQQSDGNLPYLIIHMGPDKTGTTTIQRFLHKHRKMILLKDNYDASLSRGSDDKEHGRLVNYFMSCFIPAKRSGKAACNPDYWDERLNKIIKLGRSSATTTTTTNLILSTEEFRWSTLRNDAFSKFIASLTPHFRVRIVLVYRRYFEWLPSRYNQEWKGEGPDATKVMKWPNAEDATVSGGQVIPAFSAFYQWERNGTCVNNNDNNKVDCSVYFTNRRNPKTHMLTHPVLEMKTALQETLPSKDKVEVQIVNFHDDNLLETFCCHAIPMATASCEKAQKVPKVKNPSGEDIHYDTIAVAAHQRGWIANGIARNTAKAKVYDYWTNQLQHQTTLENLPVTCMDSELLEEFRRMSHDFEMALQPSMASSHDDDFRRAVANNKFCNVDTDTLLRDPKWQSFFASLQPNEDTKAAMIPKEDDEPAPDLPNLIIHMGPDKTGTTSIQDFLVQHADVLKQDSYDARLSRGTKDKFLNSITSYLVGVSIDGRKGKTAFTNAARLKGEWNEKLQTIIDVAYKGSSPTRQNLILSTEELRWGKFWSIDWGYFLEVMKKHFRIRIVLVYRRYFEWLPSRYNEEWRIKGPEGKKVMSWPNENGGQYTPTFSTFYQWERNGTCVQQKLKCSVYFAHRLDNTTGTLTHPALEMKKHLASKDVEVNMVSFHADNLLEEFFCRGVPNANLSCQEAKKKVQKLRNPSKDEVNYDLIAVEAKKQGLVPDGLSRNFVKLRARKHLLTDLNQTIANVPLKCLNGELLEEFRRISYEAELALLPSMSTSHDDAFYKAEREKKFCNIDAERLLQDEQWRSYISTMEAN